MKAVARTIRLTLPLLLAISLAVPAKGTTPALKACKAPSVDAGFVRKLRHDARTSCRGARSISAEWVQRYLDGRFTRRFRGWRCEGRSRIRCVRGARLIRFNYGV